MTPTPSSPSAADLQTLFGEERPRRWWRRGAFWVAAAAVLLGAGGLYVWQAQKVARAAPVFVTEPLSQGNLTLTVAANGTLQPTRVVSIGSELSGTVRRVLVDVNDRVQAGQVLLELDSARFHDQVQRSQGALAVAQAQQVESAASVREAQASLARLEEVARLSGGQVPSAAELDGARAALERALAGEASALANVSVAHANLASDETNLSKASIRSPIDGVVLARSVDPGNAVAATLQAVTLFSIAENLTQLRLDVNVDEADVGVVRPGQTASFTVSAHPGRRYPALIRRVAFGATLSDNVVTYVATLNVDNSDQSLRPGMTAAATIVATERVDVLQVPNSALRFSPSLADAAAAPAARSGVLSTLLPGPPRFGPRKTAGVEAQAAGARQIWVLHNGQPQALPVQTGISDGRMTEVSGADLQVGMAVITDQRSATGAR